MIGPELVVDNHIASHYGQVHNEALVGVVSNPNVVCGNIEDLEHHNSDTGSAKYASGNDDLPPGLEGEFEAGVAPALPHGLLLLEDAVPADQVNDEGKVEKEEGGVSETSLHDSQPKWVLHYPRHVVGITLALGKDHEKSWDIEEPFVEEEESYGEADEGKGRCR